MTSVEKSRPPDNVIKAVGSALLARVTYWCGEERTSRHIVADRTALPTLESHNTWFDVHSAKGSNDLTTRELNVLGELCRWHSNKTIGRHLDLAENTVKLHLKSIYRKLDLESWTETIHAAIQHVS